MARVTCNAIGCATQIGSHELFCDFHRRMIESDTRRVLLVTYRPGRPLQSKVFQQTLQRAVNEVLYFVTEGHRPPRDRTFMWDEEEKIS